MYPAAGAEDRDLFVLGHLPERTGVGVKRVTVEEHHGGPNSQELVSQFHIIQPQVVK